MLVLVGVPGAGKTTVLKELLKERKDISVVCYGDVMLEIGLKKGIVKSRDEFSNIPGLPVSVHLKIQGEAVKAIKDTPKTILDTHVILRRELGYIAGLSPALLKKIKIDALVLIDAPNSEIIARRVRDMKIRKRQISEKIEEELNALRDLSKSTICAYAAATGAPFYFINNRENKIKETVQAFLKVLKDIGW